jgi:hypothetical protein
VRPEDVRYRIIRLIEQRRFGADRFRQEMKRAIDSAMGETARRLSGNVAGVDP